jgi:hypothetical protein
MPDSIKTQIIAKLIAICEPLVTQSVVRKVVRKHMLFLTEAVTPALHVVVGDEKELYQDERGYCSQFPVAFQIIFAENRDPEKAADEFESFLQTAIEADEQLGGLCSKITYNGAAPFVLEETNPASLAVVTYLVEYRRVKGQPSSGY